MFMYIIIINTLTLYCVGGLRPIRQIFYMSWYTNLNSIPSQRRSPSYRRRSAWGTTRIPCTLLLPPYIWSYTIVRHNAVTPAWSET